MTKGQKETLRSLRLDGYGAIQGFMGKRNAFTKVSHFAKVFLRFRISVLRLPFVNE